MSLIDWVRPLSSFIFEDCETDLEEISSKAIDHHIRDIEKNYFDEKIDAERYIQ